MGKGVKERGAMGFMQKYYHKGAFFMENDENNKKKEAIYNRDYNEALSEDKAVVKLAEGPYEGSKVLQVLPISSRVLACLGHLRGTYLDTVVKRVHRFAEGSLERLAGQSTHISGTR